MFARKWLILGLALLAAIAGGVKVVSQAFASTASQIAATARHQEGTANGLSASTRSAICVSGS